MPFLRTGRDRSEVSPNSHGERIDIFVELIEQSDGLNDHVINPIDVEFHFSTWIGMAKTQLSFILILIC